MKKHLTYLVFFISVLAVQIVMAQGDESRRLLEKVSQAVKSYDNITLTFDYHLDNKEENIHHKTSGKINIEGDKYHLIFMGSDRICDGNKIYSIIHEDEEVYISDADESSNEFTPSSILNFYKKGYRYRWGKPQIDNGIRIQEINLTPIKNNNDITNIVLGIDTKTNHISYVSYIDKKNTKTTLKIRSCKPNVELSPNEFIFDRAKYIEKNYSVTEL